MRSDGSRPLRCPVAPRCDGRRTAAGWRLPAMPSRQQKNVQGRNEEAATSTKRPKSVRIDLEGIERRVLAFPVPDGRYGQIAGAPGRALFTSFPLHGALDGEQTWDDDDDEEAARCAPGSSRTTRARRIAEDVSCFDLSRNRKKLLYFSGRRLRVISATREGAGRQRAGPRKTGWIDLIAHQGVGAAAQASGSRCTAKRGGFSATISGREDMAEVDWQAVYERYFPLIERVSTRSEVQRPGVGDAGRAGHQPCLRIRRRLPAVSPHYSQGALARRFTLGRRSGRLPRRATSCGRPLEPGGHLAAGRAGRRCATPATFCWRSTASGWMPRPARRNSWSTRPATKCC